MSLRGTKQSRRMLFDLYYYEVATLSLAMTKFINEIPLKQTRLPPALRCKMR
jgi:hypothetical protein